MKYTTIIILAPAFLELLVDQPIQPSYKLMYKGRKNCQLVSDTASTIFERMKIPTILGLAQDASTKIEPPILT